MNTKHLKKITAFLGALTLAVTLCACGDSSQSTAENNGSISAAESSADKQAADESAEAASDADNEHSKADSEIISSGESSGNNASDSGAEQESGGNTESKQDSQADAQPDSSSSAEDSPAPADSKPESAGDYFKVGDKMTLGIEPFTAKAGQKAVPVRIQIWNNSGFAAGGIKLYYDKALDPVLTGETSPNGIPMAKFDCGDIAKNMLKTCLVNTEDHLMAFGFMGSEAVTENGDFLICYFDIPDKAESGTTYHFTLQLDRLNDSNQNVTAETVTGALTIE